MRSPSGNRVVHLELRTGNLACACAVFSGLLGWEAETVHAGDASYVTLAPGGPIDTGVVEDDTERGFWLPYVEVADVAALTGRAEELGLRVLLAPREGPTGWRSVIASPTAGVVALWQPKCRAPHRR